MIEIDNGPLVLGCIIALALVAPSFYSFFIDRFKK
jgi:hypothetical protein